MTGFSASQRSKRVKKPKHSVVTRSYKFPLETTTKQNAKLFDTLALCIEVRNILVQEREDNRILQRQAKADGKPAIYLTKRDQEKRLVELRQTDVRLQTIHSQVLLNIASRVDAGTKAWMSAVKAKRSGVRPPQVIEDKNKKDYHSFTYPQYGNGCKVKQGRLYLSFLGEFRLIDYRKMRGLAKTLTITFEDGRWWAIITCAMQEKDVLRSASHPDVQNLPDTGIDTGLKALLTTAHAQVFDPPKAMKQAQSGLRKAQRAMSRKFEARKKAYATEQKRRKEAGEALQPALKDFPFSNRLKRSIKVVAKRHTKVKNQRKDAHFKIARTIEQTYRRLAVEEHPVMFMFKNRRQAKAAADRGIYGMKQTLKAVMGSRYVAVPNQRPGIGGNSQTCVCGASVPKTLKDRVHDCPSCGLKDDRDVVSANISMLIGFGTTTYPKHYMEHHQEQDHQHQDVKQLQSSDGLSASVRGETEGVREIANSGSARTAEVLVKREPRVTVKHREEVAGGKDVSDPTAMTKTPRHRKRLLYDKVPTLSGEGVPGVPSAKPGGLYGSPGL